MPKTPAPVVLDVLEPPTPGSELERFRQALVGLAAHTQVRAVAESGATLHVVLRGRGREQTLPAAWEQLVLRMLEEAFAGRYVEVRTEAAEEIGTERFAELLGVSRPTAAALVDGGAVPSRVTPGGHRRVRLADVSAFLRRRARQRASIAELVAHGADAGLPLETPPELREDSAETGER